MHEYPGRFIVIEGADGSGKATQMRLLAQRLQAAGHEVEVFDFPRYDKASSHFVKSYLNGDYGPAAKISPYAASIFYALDRYEAAPDIRKALKAGKIVLSNRYVGSNMGHQGSKFSDDTEQRGFFVWEDSFEFELMGIPRPDINLYLRVPANISFKLIKERSDKTKIKRDEHEMDREHLAKAVATYDVLCKLFPKDFVAIECADKKGLLGIAPINNLIWEQIRDVLPPPTKKGKGAVVKLGELGFQQPVVEEAPAPETPRADKKQKDNAKISILLLLKLLATPGISWEISRPPKFSGEPSEYYQPPNLDPKLTKQYKAAMRRLGELYQQLAKKLPDSNLSQLVLPMGAYAPVKLSGSKEALTSLVRDLESADDAEQSQLAGTLRRGLGLPEAKDSSNHQDSLLQKVKEGLNGTIAPRGDELTLLDYSPKLEFSLLADGLYPHTDLSRQEIQDGIDLWSYDRKEKALVSVLTGEGAQLLDEVKYRWDGLTSGAAILRSFQSGLAKDIKLQSPSPRFGYDVPDSIEEHGATDEFMEAYDLSLELFSALQAAGRYNDAAYAALIGHKCRWQFSVTARAIISNPEESNTVEYANLLTSLKDKISEVHPIVYKVLDKPMPQPAAQTEKPQTTKRHRSRRHGKKTPPKDL